MPPDGLSSVGGTCVGDVDEEVDAATVDASLIADGVIMLSGAPGFSATRQGERQIGRAGAPPAVLTRSGQQQSGKGLHEEC